MMSKTTTGQMNQQKEEVAPIGAPGNSNPISLPAVVILGGSGTMGPGIALEYALAGYLVRLCGRSPERLQLALERLAANFGFLVEQQAITLDQSQTAQAHISSGEVSDTDMEHAGIIIESISEQLTPKQNLLRSLEVRLDPKALILSNTSGLRITDIANGLLYPERVVGTHYWNPPFLMPLVEVIPGKRTDPALYERVITMLTEMGKTPVRVKKEIAGFIWNRLQFALLRECLHLVEEGVTSPEDIDRVVEMGLARRSSLVGPFKTADLGGLDVFLTIADYLFKELSVSTEPPQFWRDKVRKGELGLKSGRGFYEWTGNEGQKVRLRRDKKLLALLRENPEG